jgi:hypothetical protein
LKLKQVPSLEGLLNMVEFLDVVGCASGPDKLMKSEIY